jgi:hypothetical protein
VQRFLHAELSWLRSGQITTLFSSFTENEPVSGARGGMADSMSQRKVQAERGALKLCCCVEAGWLTKRHLDERAIVLKLTRREFEHAMRA